MSNLKLLLLPNIQGCVVSLLKRFLQCAGECYGVLNAGIHALATGGTMNMRGILRTPHGSVSLNQAALSPFAVRSVKEESRQINNMNHIPCLPVFSAPCSVSAATRAVSIQLKLPG